MSSIYDWSLKASENARIDNEINWAEGQPPSSVNNSARAMMQRIREFIADISIIPAATGSQNNIKTLITSQPSSYIDGITVRVRASATNSGASNLELNSLGSRPIYKVTYKGVVPLDGGEILNGAIYEFVFSQALNSGNGGWLLTSPTAERSLPAGMVAPFASQNVPNGWLVCNGQAVSRAVFSELFNAIGTVWGAGDGWSSFNVPDYRGMFLRGWDAGRGIDSGRGFASFQGSQNLSHNHGGTTSNNGQHSHTVNTVVDRQTNADGSPYSWVPTYKNGTVTTSENGNHTHTIYSDGGNEARPVNITVTYGIKV